MEKENLEDGLVFFGLSNKEARVYVYLLRNGLKEASEISHALDITKADVYKSLKSLERMGICEEIISHPSRFRALPLREALSSLILRQNEKIMSLSKAKEEIVSTLGEISLPTAEPKIQILQGREPTVNKIRRIRRSSYDVIIYVRERTLTFLYTLGLLDVKKIAEGLSIRILTRLTPKTIELARECEHCKFRSIHDDSDMNLPEFAVFDKKEALIALSASNKSAITDKDELALWSDSQATVMILAALFEKMWKNAGEPQNLSKSNIETNYQ